MATGRALHFVFKIPDRALTVKFYREILGMKVMVSICQIFSFFFHNFVSITRYRFVSTQVLRHEEFADGCEAACNG